MVSVPAATRGYLRLPSPNRHFPPRSRMYDLHVAEGCVHFPPRSRTYDLHVAEGCVQRKKHHEGTCMILAYHQTRMGVSGSGSLSHPHLWPTARCPSIAKHTFTPNDPVLRLHGASSSRTETERIHSCTVAFRGQGSGYNATCFRGQYCRNLQCTCLPGTATTLEFDMWSESASMR